MVRKILYILVLFLSVLSPLAQSASIESLYQERKSDVQVKGGGKVIRILPDDNKGSRHQKFILKLTSGLTLLIAHNIDLAPRVKNLSNGDTVYFYGEYEWSAKGGVVHWTHRDPQNKHAHGWLKHKGRVYK